jgi:hypothetical protein
MEDKKMSSDQRNGAETLFEWNIGVSAKNPKTKRERLITTTGEERETGGRQVVSCSSRKGGVVRATWAECQSS